MTNSDVTIAQERETLRMTDGTYKTIPQYFLKGLMDNYSYYLAMRMKNEFYCHIASDGVSIAFTPNQEKLVADRQVVSKIGRFISKVYNPYAVKAGYGEISAENIAKISNEWRQVVDEKPAQLLYCEQSRDAIAEVYTNGPNSCMSSDADDFYTGNIHPTEVYATDDIKLAYIKRGSRITARCLINKTNDQYTRIYGDSATMKPLLTALNLTSGDLTGARLLRIDNDRESGLVMPYLDGEGAIYSTNSNEYVRVGRGVEHLGQADSTQGMLEDNGICCDECGDHTHEENIHYIECSDRHVCESCVDNSYTWSDYDEAMIHNDNAVYVEGHDYMDENNHYIIECNGKYYLGEEIHEYDIVEINGDYYPLDECVMCEYSEEWILADDATECEGGVYVADEYAREVGGLTYVKDSDELAEAITESVDTFKLELESATA
tara:strand:+ start:1877 stop:3181 length:1305 start_codon:yes stop_codon:yes gene_type:complete